MRVLVTGAAGFLGAHLVRGIARNCPDARVVATDLPDEPAGAVRAFWAPSSDRIAYDRLDVTDRPAVAALIGASRPTHVVHAAAVTPTPDEEREHPHRVLDVNLGGTLAVVDAATRCSGLRRMLFVSSAALFASPAARPLAEDDPTDAVTLYATAKRAGEGVLTRLGQLRGVSTVSLRLASVYGAMERASASRPRTSHVHRLAAATGPASVAGPDIVRDWVHADDVAWAVARLLAAPSLAHDLYHVGGGEAVGWHRVQAAFRAAGRQVRDASLDAAGLVMTDTDARPVLAIDRVVAEFGFRPRSIEAGIRDLVSEIDGTRVAA